MSYDPSKPFPRIIAAFKAGDIAEIANLFAEFPEIEQQGVLGSSSWLHYAAAYSPVSVLEFLIERGYDINSTHDRDGLMPLAEAAYKNRLESAKYLLDRGAIMDTSLSVRNPLFGAIVGQSPEMVRLLLDRGIDATVRYFSDTMHNMDALAFALERGLVEESGNVIAEILALHLAKNDRAKADQLIEEAREIMLSNGRLFDPEPEYDD